MINFSVLAELLRNCGGAALAESLNSLFHEPPILSHALRYDPSGDTYVVEQMLLYA